MRVIRRTAREKMRVATVLVLVVFVLPPVA